MLAEAPTSKTSAWRLLSAFAAVAALLPLQAAAAGAATAASVAGSGLPAAGGQQLHRAADISTDADNASAGQLRTLHGADDLGDADTAPGRDLLMRRKKGRNGKKSKRAKRAKRGKRGKKAKKGKKARKVRKDKIGKKAKKGKMAGLFPPTPKGEAMCTAIAAVEEVQVYDAEFLHASAIAELFEMVCSEPEWISLENVVEVFIQRDAIAFAQATAAAVVDCQSTDEDAYLCASITASAKAFAQTVVTAHVEATAEAVRGCGCQDSITGFGTSQFFINLVTQASATATASACIQGCTPATRCYQQYHTLAAKSTCAGTGRTVSEAYSTCTSHVFARVFARAAAQAIVEGDCLNGQAVAALLLEADALDVTAGSTCGDIADVSVVPGEVSRSYSSPYDEDAYDY